MKVARGLLIIAVAIAIGCAHVAAPPSVRETVSSIHHRLRTTVAPEELVVMTPEQALSYLTEEEKEILGSEHITFSVNVPVVVSVFRDVTQGEVPFWLEGREFQKGEGQVQVEDEHFEVWSRPFPAGVVGLGVNSIGGGGDHYFVSIAPVSPQAKVVVSDIHPDQHTLGEMKLGEQVYAGSGDRVAALPEALEGQILLRGDSGRRREAQITGVFQVTEYPATVQPDQILLTWSDDPRTTQTIQWRTNTEVTSGTVRYIEAARAAQAQAADWREVAASTAPLENNVVVNDPVCHRHTAVLTGLQPGTTYSYAVSDASTRGWSASAEFTTAPAEPVSFSFIYQGDVQMGFDGWGKLMETARAKHPEAAFHLLAGDLVNRGNERSYWDSFFHYSGGIFASRPLVPCLGNHEYQHNQGPWLYLEMFTLPENGPTTIPPECGYAFEYSDVLFVVLDGNLPASDQAQWLEEQLAGSDATWKFVMFHQPVYSAGPYRDNPEIRELWGALFDKYHVDLALQGHDHAYLRSYPMFDGKRVSSPAEGTIYIVSFSGMKMYELGEHEYTEVGMANVPTYQVLDIDAETHTLTYRAYDVDGVVRDEFVIDK
ncbi:MAG TPA: metallophosphoesterase family protein [Candidatus Hydrogenedentes bacterium]|nr:metallophosphoesterase family protein [Candidatus Hydrogenedentota bacterium]